MALRAVWRRCRKPVRGSAWMTHVRSNPDASMDTSIWGVAPDTERLHRPKGYSTILVNKDTLEVIGLIGLVKWCPTRTLNYMVVI